MTPFQRISLLLLTAISLGACSAPGDNLSFTGLWNVAKENGISGEITNSVQTVSVSKNRFRVTTRDDENETIEMYDGRVLHRQVTSLRGVEPGEAPPTPAVSAVPKSDAEVENRRFWKRDLSGTGTAGGLIAGRDTLLYQAQEKMRDGEMTIQVWVDAEKKMILKKIFTIYSAQIEQMVSKTREECVEIRFGPVDESAFAKI